MPGPPSWTEQAACLAADPAHFDPDSAVSRRAPDVMLRNCRHKKVPVSRGLIETAATFCRGCPVRADCEVAARSHTDARGEPEREFGVWGGWLFPFEGSAVNLLHPRALAVLNPAPAPPPPPPVPDDEVEARAERHRHRAAHAAYSAGDRDPLVMAGEQAYQRLTDELKRIRRARAASQNADESLALFTVA